MHFNVTTNPTAQWVTQQLRESFPDNSASRYLIYDNDSISSDERRVLRDHVNFYDTERVHTPRRTGT